MKSNTDASSFYSLMQNQAGDLLLIVDAEETEPRDPLLIYDGGDTMLLHRNIDSTRALRNLQDNVPKTLLSAKSVHVVEYDGDDLVRDYDVTVRIVDDVNALIW